MDFAECCKDCVMNNQCLLQDHNEVEYCEDYQTRKEKECHHGNVNQ